MRKKATAYFQPNDDLSLKEPSPEEIAKARSRAAHCSALAERFHALYEEIAPLYCYETRKETRKWDPESPNGKLMIATCNGVMGPVIAVLQAIAEMPEYDQDDAHRLRNMARQFLSQNVASEPRRGEHQKS